MKTDKIHPVIFCFLLFTLCGCLQEIDLEELRPAPTLVFNSIVVAGEPVTASVSRTWFYTEDNPNVTIQDAQVHLYVNGKFEETLTWQEGDSEYNGKGYYQSVYLPKAGDRINIMASAKGYEPVTAETHIPTPIAIENIAVEYHPATSGSVYEYRDKFRVTFTDTPNQKDYYLVRFSFGYPQWDAEANEYTGEYVWDYRSVDFDDEPLITGDVSAFDKIMGYNLMSGYYGRVFSDELIPGKTYTLTGKYNADFWHPGPNEWHADEEYTGEILPNCCKVHLYTISEEYYKYMKVILEADDKSFQSDLVEAGLAEPIRHFSNVEGGIGILGSSNYSEMTIELKSFRENNNN